MLGKFPTRQTNDPLVMLLVDVWVFYSGELSEYFSLKIFRSPLKIGRNPKGNEKVFQPSIFQVLLLLVSGRVIFSKRPTLAVR